MGALLDGLRRWTGDTEYLSVKQPKAAMSQANRPDPAAFERGNDMKALVSFTRRTV